MNRGSAAEQTSLNKNVKRSLTEEHQDGPNPLHPTHDVTKQDDRAKDGEELPGSGDDGAGQGSEVHHRHKDEGLGGTKFFFF